MSASLETHSSFVRSSARRIARRLLPSGREVPPVTVKILQGLHAGSEATFDGPSITVGPDPDFDVMLIDDDLADGWLIVTLQSSFFGPLGCVEAHHDHASVAGTPLVMSVPSEPVGLPCRVRVGGIELEVADANQERPTFNQRAATVAIPLLFSAGLAVLGYLMVREYSTRSPVELTAASVAAPDPRIEDRTKTANVLTDILDASGLRRFLTVREDAAGAAVYVQGTVPAQLMPQWQKARSSIDALMLDKVVITKVVPSVAVSDLPTIAAVRLGPKPQVILANGLKVAVGEPIKDDWLVDTIKGDQMTLRRDTEVVDIKF